MDILHGKRILMSIIPVFMFIIADIETTVVCLTIEALKCVVKQYRKVHEIIVNMVHV